MYICMYYPACRERVMKSWLRLNCRRFSNAVYSSIWIMWCWIYAEKNIAAKLPPLHIYAIFFLLLSLRLWLVIFCVRFDWKNLSEIIITLKFMAVFFCALYHPSSVFFHQLFCVSFYFCPLLNRNIRCIFCTRHLAFIRFCII